MTTTGRAPEAIAWYALSAEAVAGRVGVDPDRGLDGGDAARRLGEHGPNQLPSEPPPSRWAVARGQLANPMNIMLLVVCGASLAIGQVATGIVVLALVSFNVVMGSSQELKARASVEALARMQVPHVRVRWDGEVTEIEATQVVPGDVALLEAGDVVPADGRIFASASLEIQEAALTGESAPVAKDRGTLPGENVPLGDRTNLLFQNTQVTRGDAALLVTATGQDTQMGQIADMVTATKRSRSPLKRIDLPEKNWKFSAADARERQHWDEYQRAFSQMLSATSTTWAPWYVIPADRKWFVRLCAGAVLAHTLIKINPQYPEVSRQARQELQAARRELETEAPARPKAAK